MSYYSLLLLTFSFGLLFNLQPTCVAQNACKGNDVDVISTDPDNPNSPVRNNWDWRKPLRYTIWTSQTKSIKVPNPFNGGGTGISNTNLNHFQSDYYNYGNEAIDFHPEGGWELLIKKFGYDKYGDVSGEDRPFLAFYNRYTGKIRVFLLIIDEPQTAMNGAQIKMTYKQNGERQESALLANAKPISSSVRNFPQKHQVQSPSYYSNEDEYWIYAEFSTAFDPCACMYKSNLRFNFELLDEYQLQLNGEINGKITEVVDKNNNVQTGNGYKSNFTWKDIKEGVKEGKKGYKSGKDFKNEAQKFIDSNADFIKDDIGLQIDDLKQFTKGIPYANAAINVYDFLMGGGKQKAQNKDFHPMAFEAGLNFKGDGSLKSTKTYKNQEFATPGSSPNEDPNGKFIPYYNHLLGVFNLLEKPTLEYVDYDQNRERISDYGDGKVDVSLPDIRQISSSKFKYVLNPASGLKAKSIKAAIQYKIDSNFYLHSGGNLSLYDSNMTSYPKPVEFAPPWNTPDSIQKRFNREGWQISHFPTPYPDTPKPNVILRSNYVPLSCFHKLSLFHYVPSPTKGPMPGIDINLKLKAELERKDGNGQNVLMVRTYDFKLKEKGKENSNEFSFEHVYLEYPVGKHIFYPKALFTNGSKNTLLPNKFHDVRENVHLLNQTVNNGQNAYETITVENSTVKPGVALRAGKEIIIKGQSDVQKDVLLTTDGPLPSCGEPNHQYQATQQELQTFCNSSAYQDRIQLAKKGPEPQPKSEEGKDIKKPIQAHLSPNPVKNNAQVGFKLPKKGQVKISIQGVSGRSVKANVVNQTFSKGPHRVSIQTGYLSPGFYICVIQTRFGRETMRFVKQ